MRAGSGARPVPVSTQLGGGAAHSARADGAPRGRSSGHGVQSTHRTPGRARPTCRHAVEAAGDDAASRSGLSPRAGPVRRQGSSVPLERKPLSGGRHDGLRGIGGGGHGPWPPRPAPPAAGDRRVQRSVGLDLGAHRRRRGGGQGEEAGRIEGLPAVEHMGNGAGELVSQDGEGLGFAVLLREASDVPLGRGILAQAEDGGLGEGPPVGRTGGQLTVAKTRSMLVRMPVRQGR